MNNVRKFNLKGGKILNNYVGFGVYFSYLLNIGIGKELFIFMFLGRFFGCRGLLVLSIWELWIIK